MGGDGGEHVRTQQQAADDCHVAAFYYRPGRRNAEPGETLIQHLPGRRAGARQHPSGGAQFIVRHGRRTERVTAPRQHHHVFREQCFADQVAGVGLRAQGTKDEVDITGTQLCRQ
ncbi:hypothetical protein D3C86_1257830 [compost metagenome]